MDNNQNNQEAASENTSNTTNTAERTTSNESSYVLNHTTMMASLSYLGPLVLIPLLTNRDNPFVLFHIKQGLIIIAIGLIAHFFFMIMWLYPILTLIDIVLFIFSVIGILNSLQKKEAPLPFIGQLATHIKL
ncbi:MAG: hypothetical protein H6779_03405 [Candidatus Nomurabacteria bacterium]|nr:hypothetical protein [Candidatus Nomurabacteria bacterium]USN87434.1 MAG: hypothetical protein H6779_03405 [Candidatus Nomurabacteria bacterium]